MSKPLRVLKPYLLNALVPSLVKNLVYSLPILIIGYFLLYYFKIRTFLNFGLLILVFFIVFMVPLIIKLVILHFTKYYFFEDRVVSEFKFIVFRSHAATYRSIVEVKLDISLWDRICKSGSLLIHTAENKSRDLALKYIKNPVKIEKGLYKLINKQPRIR